MKRRLIGVATIPFAAAILLFLLELSAKALLPGINTNVMGDLLQRSLNGFNLWNLIIIVIAVFAGSAVAAKWWNEDSFWSYIGQYAVIIAFIAVGQFASIGLGVGLHGIFQRFAGWIVGADKAIVDAAVQNTVSGINWIAEMSKIILGWFSHPQWLFANLVVSPLVALLTAKGPAILAFGSDDNG